MRSSSSWVLRRTKRKKMLIETSVPSKSLSINEFFKLAEAERYLGGRGRGHSGAHGDRGGYQGLQGGYSFPGPVPVPSIADQLQFPTLGGKRTCLPSVNSLHILWDLLISCVFTRQSLLCLCSSCISKQT